MLNVDVLCNRLAEIGASWMIHPRDEQMEIWFKDEDTVYVPLFWEFGGWSFNPAMLPGFLK